MLKFEYFQGVLLNYCGNKKDTLLLMPPLIIYIDNIFNIDYSHVRLFWTKNS
jgi:hypothetical protein